jgi:hypothetical protein
VIGLHFRELWESCRTYRCDGLWDKKKKFVLFPLRDEMNFDFPHQYHTYWHYRELDGKLELLPYNLYHLKMIKKEEREKRAALYNALDPNLEIQPIGYDYLIDENGLLLSRVEFKKRYSYSTVPSDLR